MHPKPAQARLLFCSVYLDALGVHLDGSRLHAIVTMVRDAHASFQRWDTGGPVQVRDGGFLKMLGAVIGESECAKYM